MNGQPAPKVKLEITSVGRPTKTGMFDGVNIGSAHLPDALRNWPRPVTTDDLGRFTLAGIGRDVMVSTSVRDGRFAGQNFRIQTDNHDGAKEFSQSLEPATIIDGQVVAADTGEPIMGAVISMSSGAHVRTDEHGHYTTDVRPAIHYRAEVFPPDGTPYLAIEQDVSCPKGTVKQTEDVKLPRGVLLQGKVIEKRSGRSIAGASVQWLATRSRAGVIEGWQSVVATRDDGSYQIVVPPGKGHLFVYGPTSDYVLELIGSRMLAAGMPGGERYYAHDIIPWEVNAGDSPHEFNSELRPGVIVRGRLIGPAGQTVDKAEIVALLHFNYFHLNWRGDLTIHAHDGSFELHGLDPEKATRVSFLDADHQWGADRRAFGRTVRQRRRGPAPAVRKGESSLYHARWQTGPEDLSPARNPRQQRPLLADQNRRSASTARRRRGCRRQPRSQTLLEWPVHRRRGPHHASEPDPRCDLSD